MNYIKKTSKILDLLLQLHLLSLKVTQQIFLEVVEAGWCIISAQSYPEMPRRNAASVVVHCGWKEQHAAPLHDALAERINGLLEEQPEGFCD